MDRIVKTFALMVRQTGRASLLKPLRLQFGRLLRCSFRSTLDVGQRRLQPDTRSRLALSTNANFLILAESLFIVFVFFRFVAGNVFAATPNLTIVPPIGLIRTGDTVAMTMRVDSGGENMNAVEGVLSYPTDRLRFVRADREQSIFPLWTEEPTADTAKGIITFTGGRPNGIVADNAALFTVYFEALEGGEAALSFDAQRSALYAHDGNGTKIPISPTSATFTITDSLVEGILLSSSTHPKTDSWSRGGRIDVAWSALSDAVYSYDVSADSQHVPDDAPESAVGKVVYESKPDGIYYFVIKVRPSGGNWSAITQRRFLLDALPPEPFLIVHPDPSTVDGADILTWSATDATSGIARYDLTVSGSQPVPVKSPLTLNPAWMGKTLTITAIDNAGNMQLAAWEYPKVAKQGLSFHTVLLVGGAFVVLAVLVTTLLLLWRRKR